jgi:hypothetical protein
MTIYHVLKILLKQFEIRFKENTNFIVKLDF